MKNGLLVKIVVGLSLLGLIFSSVPIGPIMDYLSGDKKESNVRQSSLNNCIVMKKVFTNESIDKIIADMAEVKSNEKTLETVLVEKIKKDCSIEFKENSAYKTKLLNDIKLMSIQFSSIKEKVKKQTQTPFKLKPVI
jgi:hypothetical protein